LQISCVGFGKQRYKFVEENKYSLVHAQQKSAPTTIIICEREVTPPTITVEQNLTNEHTYLVSAFIDKLNPLRGVSYNLTWSCGDYLVDVPVRLGRNEALDAAADALVTACDRFTNTPYQAQLFLAKYVVAVRALRLCLNDPQTASTTDVLCAVMLLLICQVSILAASISCANWLSDVCART